MTNAHSHRSDIKQKNKLHKGEKKSHKSEVVTAARSKVNSRTLNKKEQRLRCKQIRQHKQKIAKDLLKSFDSREFLQVAIIPLCKSLDPHLAVTLLKSTDPAIKEFNLFTNSENTHYIRFERFNKNVILNTTCYDSLFQTIDLVHASDCVIFLVPSNIDELISSRTNRLLKSLFSAGLPPYMFTVLSNMCDVKELKGYLESLYIIPDERVWSLNNPSDAAIFLRQLCERNLVRVPPREMSKANAGACLFVQNSGKNRSVMKCESVKIQLNEEKNISYAHLTGIVRRAPFCLDEGLREYMDKDGPGAYIHLPGYGDFPVSSATWTKESASSKKYNFSFAKDHIEATGKVNEFEQLSWNRNPEWDMNEIQASNDHEANILNEDDQNSFSDSDDDEQDSSSELEDDSEPSQSALNVEKMEESNDDDEDDISVHSVDSDQEEKMRRNFESNKKTYSSYSWFSKAETTSSSGKSVLSQAQLAKFRQSRIESQFPDEVETPQDQPAKDRFAKYRGLDRFRSSKWPIDQDPPLPMEFAKSFRFKNYNRDRRTMSKFIVQRLKSINEGKQSSLTYIPCGSLATITIGPLDAAMAASLNHHVHGKRQGSLFLWSLLPHERQFSVVHFSMKRSANAARTAPHLESITNQANELYRNLNEKQDLAMDLGEEANWAVEKTDEFLQSKIGDVKSKCTQEDIWEAEPIRSKNAMLFQVGIRRFISCPIYSESLSRVNEKAKFERYFNISLTTPTIASCYAPVVYAPQNVLQFRIRTSDELDEREAYVAELVATGSVYNVDPTRLIIKRILLSGHPYKINKRSAVVRFMFFNPDDINFFKPVQLQTKWGAFGHIKQSVGTHGHMKCVFDRQINSCDVVLMPLYKRVLPKPTYFASLSNSVLSTELYDIEEIQSSDEINTIRDKFFDFICPNNEKIDQIKAMELFD